MLKFIITRPFSVSHKLQAVLEVILHWWEGSTTSEDDKILLLREGFRDMGKGGIFEKSNTGELFFAFW